MRHMFANTNFNGDISEWDVSGVITMRNMFWASPSFQGDLSKWDVSRVADMDRMFYGAASFREQLCGSTWAHRKTTQKDVFAQFPGAAYLPRSFCRNNLPQRSLARWRKTTTPPILPDVSSQMLMCSNCGTFKKSGVASCCAPGGAWYNNCGGGGGKRNMGHSWFEGAEACKCKSHR